MKPVLLVGPSGVGKSTLIKHLIENYNFQKIVTATTRPMRSGEQNGVHYYFLSEEKYQQWVDEGKFFMDNRFLNARYGTVTQEVDDIIKSAKKEMQTIQENIELFDHTIDISNMTPEEIANELVRFLDLSDEFKLS